MLLDTIKWRREFGVARVTEDAAPKALLWTIALLSCHARVESRLRAASLGMISYILYTSGNADLPLLTPAIHPPNSKDVSVFNVDVTDRRRMLLEPIPAVRTQAPHTHTHTRTLPIAVLFIFACPVGGDMYCSTLHPLTAYILVLPQACVALEYK